MGIGYLLVEWILGLVWPIPSCLVMTTDRVPSIDRSSSSMVIKL